MLSVCWIETIMFAALCCLCTIVSITDCKTGLIHNKTLACFYVIAVVLDVLYYGFFVRDGFVDFAINIMVIIAVSLLLFFTYSFAGGDCKFLIAGALLYPARCYYIYEDSVVTLTFAIGFSIALGYIFLLSISIYDFFAQKKIICKDYIKRNLLRFAKSYLIASIYISAIGLVSYGIESYFLLSINRWIIRALSLCVALFVGRLSWLKKPCAIIPAAAVVCGLGILLHTFPFSTNIGSYVLSFVLLFFQLVIRTDIYSKVQISQLQPGMILSMMSSVMMQGTKVAGLPGISREDLRDRLTQEQVDSIGRWAKARDVERLVVVRKIPLGIFLSLGFICYFVLWSVTL